MNIKVTLLEIMVLSTLIGGEKYGYQIKKELEKNVLLGSLYNILKQLENKKLVDSKWGAEEVVEGARRKYYTINANGEAVLSEAQTFFLKQWGYAQEKIQI